MLATYDMHLQHITLLYFVLKFFAASRVVPNLLLFLKQTLILFITLY